MDACSTGLCDGSLSVVSSRRGLVKLFYFTGKSLVV